MDLSTAIRMRINNLIIERNINVSKLSTLAGISRSTLSKFLSGKRKIIRLDMIEYICEGLDIKYLYQNFQNQHLDIFHLPQILAFCRSPDRMDG